VDVISIITMAIAISMFCWVVYNIPPVIIGFWIWRLNRIQRMKQTVAIGSINPPNDFYPKVSIVVPVQNEENVIERLLTKLVSLTYENKEIIIVEDGSTDRTPNICSHWVEEYPKLIKCFRNPKSNGKPTAINLAAKEATGEIVALYDADTVVEPNILEKVVPHFRDVNTMAVQGELESLNPDESIITRLSVLNDFIVNLQQLGRDRLNLFVPLLGTNQYVRRGILKEVGYWDPEALSEDTEISVKLARKGYKVKYVPVKAQVEAPAKLRIFVRQRMKWLRGYTQAAKKHASFVRHPNWRTLDAQIMLLFPLMLIVGLVGYIATIYGAINTNAVQGYAMPILPILGVALLVLNFLSSAIVVASNPKNAVYVLLLYVDWVLLASVSFYVHLRALFRRPQSWTRTPKSGHITVDIT
jgi:cellulose synthase/poly-beta-1,6-N-acetylglucosamine synthase-like glycosyltransferase